MYCLCNENKGANQLRSYCEADLHLYFFAKAKIRFSHDAAQINLKQCVQQMDILHFLSATIHCYVLFMSVRTVKIQIRLTQMV